MSRSEEILDDENRKLNTIVTHEAMKIAALTEENVRLKARELELLEVLSIWRLAAEKEEVLRIAAQQRLAKAIADIQNAPHSRLCWTMITNSPCNCWKAEVLKELEGDL